MAITEHQWLAIASAAADGDSISAVDEARAENLKYLHYRLGQHPPLDLGRGTTWHEPHDDMKVKIHETLTRHDLVTGTALEERIFEEYVVHYSTMNPERV